MGFLSSLMDELSGNLPCQQKGYDIREAISKAEVVIGSEGIQFYPSGFELPLDRIVGYKYTKYDGDIIIAITTTCGVEIGVSTDYPRTYFHGILDCDGMMHDMPWDFHKAIDQRTSAESDLLAETCSRIKNGGINPSDITAEEFEGLVLSAENGFDIAENSVSCDAVRYVDTCELIYNFLFVISNCGTVVCKKDAEIFARLIALHKKCSLCLEKMPESGDKSQLVAALVYAAKQTLRREDWPRYSGLQGLQVHSAVLANLQIGALDSSESLLALGKDEWAEDRRYIVCSDELRSSDCIMNPPKRIFVTSAEEIGNYNRISETDERLVFAVGHPVDGMTYIQHPILKNQYIEIGEYNARMLEYRYDELVKLLSALGAKSIVCAVEERNSLARKTTSHNSAQGGAHLAIGSVSGDGEERNSTSSLADVEKKLSSRIERQPTQKPYVPDDMVFLKFEPGWKQLAEDVLSGQIKRKEMDFCFKKEYALTLTELTSVGAKIESMVPGYQFGADGRFAVNFESEEKVLSSLVWHYEVEFGDGVGCDCQCEKQNMVSVSQQEAHGVKEEKPNRVEGLILKRARQFAKADGVDLSEDHRKQLFDMGSKYGVDELRVEELIADACE